MSSEPNPWSEGPSDEPAQQASDARPPSLVPTDESLDLSALSSPIPALTLAIPLHASSGVVETDAESSRSPGQRESTATTISSPPNPTLPESPRTAPIPILSPTPRQQPQLQNIKPHRSIIDEFDPFGGQGSEPGSPGTLASFGSAPGGGAGGSRSQSRSHSRAGSSKGADTDGVLERDVEGLVAGLKDFTVEEDNVTPRSGKTHPESRPADPNDPSCSPSASSQLTSPSFPPKTTSTSHAQAKSSPSSPATRPSKEPVGPQPQFDFQMFLSQLRLKSADPIQKYLKSFLISFSRRPFTINEQIKLIHDFLSFIGDKMRSVEPWKSQSGAEFENATEAMEKLVMNRLYTYTFSPQVDSADRPLMTDDLERDAVLSQRIRMFGWVREKHLDVPEGETSQGFLAFAEQELLKVNHYKAPRDKMICILNACKVIFGLIRHESGTSSKSASADDFLPILIFVVLRANPENLISNVEYITRFRGDGKLDGEPGYYLSSLSGAISFIETLDAAGLSNITPEDFKRNVEQAISELPPGALTTVKHPRSNPTAATDASGEEPARALSALQPTIALDNTKKFFQRTGELATGAVSRPLSALGKMLLEGVNNPGNGSVPGSEDGESGDERYLAGGEKEQYRTPIRSTLGESSRSGPTSTNGSPSRPGFLASSPMAGWLPRRTSNSNSPVQSPTPAGGASGLQHQQRTRHQADGTRATGSHEPREGEHMAGRMQVDEMYARSQVDCAAPASGTQTPSDPTFNYTSLTAEIDRTHATAQRAGVETLHQMFPGLPEEVCVVVLEGCGGDLGVAIDRMLEMTAGD